MDSNSTIIQLLKQADCKTMPWKNGLGTTSEIQIVPSSANFPFDRFHWRLSSATITGPNDFSNFAGYDRILVVWKGPGLILNKTMAMEPFKPINFPGEKTIHCELMTSGETVVDYGLIYCRDSVEAKMEVESAATLKLLPGTHYLTNICGEFELDWSDGIVTAGDTVVLSATKPTVINLNTKDAANLKYFHVYVNPK